MSLALGQLAVKWSAAQLALLPRRLSSSGDIVILREKMSEKEINRRRYKNIKEKIEAEYEVVPYWYDDSLLKLERCESNDFGVLKSVLKDLRKLNRKNGVVPAPPKKNKMFHRYAGGGAAKMFKRSPDDDAVIETAQVAMEKYKKKHKLGSSLEFVSVLQVEIAHSLGRYDIMIQARDLSAAGVSIKLLAHCFLSKRHVFSVVLYRPVSFMKVLHKDKSRKTHINTGKRFG
ncbi:uncharacterized protein LOC141585801 [Silene latifolia]|uniref:uncharacterized protein LOC141585801 n=1 Tax=Silene latifolia TaxID=37657 RepID=UPI003D771B20